MKTARVALAALLAALLALAALPALAEGEFGYADLAVNGLKPGATPEDAVALLGEPAMRGEPQVEAATGDQLQTFTYDGLTLTFTDGKLSDATLTGPGFTGPRGLSVGQDGAALKAAFPFDEAQVKDGVLYAAAWVDALNMPLPPYAQRTVNGDGAALYYFVAPLSPYSAEVLASPEAFLYETSAMLTVTLGAGGQQIAAIQWHVGAMAE